MNTLGLTAGMQSLVLLGDQDRYADISRRFQRGGSTVDIADLIAFFVVIGVLIAFAWMVARYVAAREKRALNSPRQLFRELSRVHELAWSDRKLLVQIARWQGLPTPNLLFVDVKRMRGRELEAAFATKKDRIKNLRKRLFGR